MQFEWYDIKFLESASNVRNAIHRGHGRRPNAANARDIVVSLQQGRLYFEAASVSPIQIRPLLVYYGALSFSRAITVALSNKKLDDLAHAHGLSDVGTPTSIEKLTARISGRGTFQEFNDAIAPLSRLFLYIDYMPTSIVKPFDMVSKLNNSEISFIDVLSRIPDLQTLFKKTFNVAPNCLRLDLSSMYPKLFELRIDCDVVISDRSSLRAIVAEMRALYPFLNNWRLRKAEIAWGQTIIIFDNISKNMIDDLSEDNLLQHSSGKFESKNISAEPMVELIESDTGLPPLAGGYDNRWPCVIKPINDVTLNEYSLQFLGIYLLGSLVRYRPQVWQHAISRSSTAQNPPDDRAISLVEQFISVVLASFPRLVVSMLEYDRRL